jgi:hypothetical protein
MGWCVAYFPGLDELPARQVIAAADQALAPVAAASVRQGGAGAGTPL